MAEVFTATWPVGQAFCATWRAAVAAGSGLYIVRQLAKAMKGWIKFGIAEGGGLLAELELPEARVRTPPAC